MSKLPHIEKELSEVSQQEIRLRAQIKNLRDLRKEYILQLYKHHYFVSEIVNICNKGEKSITRQAVHLIIGGIKYKPPAEDGRSEEKMIKAKARYGFKNIVVDDCPFCHHTHYHNHPVGEGVRMADCFKGEYLLDFEAAEQSVQRTADSGDQLPADQIVKNYNRAVSKSFRRR